jgi:hypothetical protein
MARNLTRTLSEEDWRYIRRPGTLHGSSSERLMDVLKISIKEGLPGAIGILALLSPVHLLSN